MPYIDSTPRDYPIVFEEDNFQEVFGQMLTDNGWTLARTFYKATVDTRAYFKISDRVNYAIAKHTIYRNADGKLLGFAVVCQFNLKLRDEDLHPIRRPGDDKNPDDENFGISPSWDAWVKQRFAENNVKTNLYFYMLEKLPNSALVPDNGIVSMVTMPGMSGTEYRIDRDRDRENWYSWWYGYQYARSYSGTIYDYDSSDDDGMNELEFDGKLLTASPFHVVRTALDIEVLTTEWDDDRKEVLIRNTDPHVMQSPIVKTTLRAEFLEHVDHPIMHTNWWSDSEIRVRGHVDSNTIFLILQADNAPTWENNLIPTIPLYFGKVLSMDGDKDEGYALFAGTIPPLKRENTSSSLTTENNMAVISPTSTKIVVGDASKLPPAPAMLTIGGKEIVKLVEKEGNVITVEREMYDTVAMSPYYPLRTTIARLSTNHTDSGSNETVVSLFDFDDPKATVGEVIQPLLKLYPHHPSNGVDSVMLSKSRFGARYQAHHLSWNAPANSMLPTRMDGEGKKYPKAYEPTESTSNYKYQFNPSRYSGKIHSSRIFVVHPEEGVRGYLDKSLGFNAQSINASNLRLRKEDCPEKIFEMYKYLSIGAVSPLTKIPTTPFRPMGLGIYEKDLNPNAVPHDVDNDATPPGEVTITKTSSTQVRTVDVEYTLPEDADLKHVNIYVDGLLFAKGVTGTTVYRISGQETGFTPQIKITTVDLAGNESIGVTAPEVKVV